MKRSLLLFVCVSVLLAAFVLFAAAEEAAVPEAPAVLTGDVTGDGAVSAEDARLALRAAVGLETLTDAQQTIADVDKSGAVEAADARLILRLAVGLSIDDELTPRAPLEDEALLKLLRGSVVTLQTTRHGRTEITGGGVIVSADGKVLTSIGAVSCEENLKCFASDGTELKIARVLAENSKANLVLLQLEGSFMPLSASVEDCAEGAAVYCLRDENRALAAGTVLQTGVRADEKRYADAALFAVDITPTYSSRFCMPLVDQTGAAVGLLRYRADGRLIAETFRSCMDRVSEGETLDLSPEDYCRHSTHVQIDPMFSEVTLFPGAVACCPLAVNAPYGCQLGVSCDSEAVQVLLITHDYPIDRLAITALAPCETATIRVFDQKYAPEDSEIVIKIHVAQPDGEALINHAYMMVPDFGAIFGIVPASGGIRIVNLQNGCAQGDLSYAFPADADPEEVMETYAAWLAEFGYEYMSYSDSMQSSPFDPFTRTFFFEAPALRNPDDPDAPPPDSVRLSVELKYEQESVNWETQEVLFRITTVTVRFRGEVIPPELLAAAEG